MKLFLASHSSDPASLEKLREIIGGFSGKKIAYIPTAANGENGWESWKFRKGGTWEVVNTLKANVKAVVLEEYRNESVIKEIAGNDIVWFAGGLAGYLMYWIKRCKIDVHLKEILDGGSLYVGSSAGAMIAGQTLQISNWEDVDGERGAESIEPLKLVNFDIFPHFSDEYLDKIKGRYKSNYPIYLLKDGEEIIVEDDKITVVGEKRVINGND